jgi:hypothetical protein
MCHGRLLRSIMDADGCDWMLDAGSSNQSEQTD